MWLLLSLVCVPKLAHNCDVWAISCSLFFGIRERLEKPIWWGEVSCVLSILNLAASRSWELYRNRAQFQLVQTIKVIGI